MKFHHKNPLYLNILIILLAAIQLGIILLNVAKFAGWFGLYSSMLSMEIAQMVLAVFILIVCGFLMFMHYRIERDNIKICFCCFDLTGGKFFISRVRSVIKHSQDNGLYVSVYTTDVEPVIIKVNISVIRYEDFISCLQRENPSITVAMD